jgi:subtilase family serine protease
VATPYFAGLVAIADQALHIRLGLINPLLYRLEQVHAAGLVAVTRGSNTVRFIQNGKTVTVGGYRARPGYNLATGVGTVDAARFVQDLRLLRASSCRTRDDDHGRGPCEK